MGSWTYWKVMGPQASTQPRARRNPERPEGWDPLDTMPADAPATKQRRWRKLAEVAHRQPMAAVELKCLECVCWHRPEAARCQVVNCALYPLNRRVFTSRGNAGAQ